MKVHIYKDERYPDYGISQDDYYGTVELTEEELVLVAQADELYQKAQDLLEKKYLEIHPPKPVSLGTGPVRR